VAILDRAEQFVERLVEGTIMRFFRRPIQPSEIGRKLERAMEDSRIVSVGGPLVANDYRAELHPQDMQSFINFVNPLSQQLAGWLADQIADRGYQTLGPVTVQLFSNTAVPRRAIQVDAQTLPTALPSGPQPPIARTAVYDQSGGQSGGPPPPPLSVPQAIVPHGLRLLNGPGKDRVFTMRSTVTTIGREKDNDFILESTDVSRHHARVECNGGRWQIVDLGSTNGTKVNGQRVPSAILRPGDRIEFGTLQLEFVPQPVGAGV
jgi:hypothetical protein